jgi:hypothetical protein
MAARVQVGKDESASFGQEDLQELQDRAPPAGGPRDLHVRSATQTAAGLILANLVINSGTRTMPRFFAAIG